MAMTSGSGPTSKTNTRIAVLDPMAPGENQVYAQRLDTPGMIGELFDAAEIEVTVFAIAGADTQWPPLPTAGQDYPYAGVVLSGSFGSALDEEPCYPALTEWLLAARAAGLPVLGICFGSQFLARVFLGRGSLVRMANTQTGPEIGIKAISIAPGAADPLLEGIPPSFPLAVWHFDGFVVPPEATLLFSSDSWPGHGFRVPGTNIVGLQFHPEVGTLAKARRFYTNLEAVAGQPVAKDHQASLANLARDVGLRLARNWLSTAFE